MLESGLDLPEFCGIFLRLLVTTTSLTAAIAISSNVVMMMRCTGLTPEKKEGLLRSAVIVTVLSISLALSTYHLASLK